ncbi:drug resistance transporter, EmrB/QacA subfamily [Pseudomonas helmanticensis]|uniref:Drug resistance transporter, EmrB/QacA subfamily n=1 Tax=Pseudomonas helmanticensis TaxID=1471381 RepID=A0ACD2U6U2_9PSED|nr:MFS transporter [Pseudomonas helmanticensis]SMQ26499.1 drug resistance transporter, EmrB/QacA subfamily [Pseudomonas helmanticensis]
MAYRSKVALVYLLGFALDLLNMFVASIAYPDIAQQLHASVTQLAWISNAYMLGLTLIIPLSVWLAARMGERRLILASLLLFGIGSALVAQAGSIESLIGWRLLQGLGGGLLLPVGQALAYRQFPPSQRAHFTGVVLLVALMVPALSPAAGGLIVQALSWRWIFYLNLPVALLAFGLGLFWLKPDQPSSERPTLDARGLLLAATALSLLLIAVSLVSETDSRTLGLFVLMLSVVTLCIYLRDGWRKPEAILDLQLIKNPSLRLAMLIYLCVPGVFTGTHMIAVLYLHNLGVGAAQTGALMLPWAAGSGIAIMLGKRSFNRVGPKPLLGAGMLLQCLGIALLMRIEQPASAPLIIAYALMGLGGSLCSVTAQTLAFVGIATEKMGHSSALWNINRQLGFCLGAALLSSLLGALGGDGFRYCFLAAALLTMLPMVSVLRFDSTAVLALLTQTPLKEKST